MPQKIPHSGQMPLKFEKNPDDGGWWWYVGTEDHQGTNDHREDAEQSVLERLSRFVKADAEVTLLSRA